MLFPWANLVQSVESSLSINITICTMYSHPICHLHDRLPYDAEENAALCSLGEDAPELYPDSLDAQVWNTGVHDDEQRR